MIIFNKFDAGFRAFMIKPIAFDENPYQSSAQLLEIFFFFFLPWVDKAVVWYITIKGGKVLKNPNKFPNFVTSYFGKMFIILEDDRNMLDFQSTDKKFEDALQTEILIYTKGQKSIRQRLNKR